MVPQEEKKMIVESPQEKVTGVQKQSFVVGNNNVWVPDKAKQGYHEQRLSQSKWAFRISIWGSIFGFVIFAWAVKKGIDLGGDISWIGIVSGAIVEIVSALFYVISSKANEKISEFFKELTIDSNVKDAIKLVDRIEDKKIKDELLTKLSLHLSGIDEDKICKNTQEICKKDFNE